MPRHDEPAAAIDHALAAGDYADAVALLETHARPLVLGGYAQTVAGWLQRLPPAWQAAGPQANVAFAWSLLLRGQLDEIERYLRNAEAGLAGTRRSAGRPVCPHAGAPGAGRLARQRYWGCVPAWFRCAGRPSAPAPWRGRRSPWRPPDDIYVQGATRFCLATACNYAGRTVEAIAAYQEALPLCRTAGNARCRHAERGQPVAPALRTRRAA